MDEPGRLGGVGSRLGDHRDDGGVAVGVDHRVRGEEDVLIGAERVDQRAQLGGVGRGVAGEGHGQQQRAVHAGAEALGHEVVGLAAGGVLGVAAGIGLAEAHRHERHGHHDQHRGGGHEVDPGVAGHVGAPAHPATGGGDALGPLAGLAGLAGLGPREAGGGELHPGEAEQRGEQRDRGDHHDGDDDGGGVAHRGDERDADERQAADGDDDGAAGEDHGLTGGGVGPGGGLLHRHALGEVLAVAGDDEERVVDADAEADHRGEDRSHLGDVHEGGHDGDGGEAGGQAEQGEPDGHPAGDDGAEGHQEDDDGGGDADHLGGAGLGPLGVADELAAELHLHAVGAGVLDHLHEVLVGAGGQVAGRGVVLHEGHADGPVGRHGAGDERVDHPADVIERLEAVDGAGQDGGVVGVVERAVLGVEDDLGADAGHLREALDHQVEGLLRLGAGDPELVAQLPAGAPGDPEEAEGEGEPGEHDELAVADGGTAETVEETGHGEDPSAFWQSLPHAVLCHMSYGVMSQ